MPDIPFLLFRASKPSRNSSPSWLTWINQSASSPLGFTVKAILVTMGGLGLVGLGGCSTIRSSNPGSSAKAATHQAQGTGELEIRANGEDFVRDGFISKDGWAIRFEHLYVGLADVAALQTKPPFDPDWGVKPNIQSHVNQAPVTVVDLADDSAPTALVAQFPKAQAGRYNALGWRITPAPSGPSQGQSLSLVGQATQGSETISFVIDWDESYQYLCGDFIGDQRKGILKAGDRADLEATFHFDHVFGDGDAPPEDELNQDALGFGPLAALAEDGSLSSNRSALQSQLDPADFNTLEKAIAGLAHVGEGHCQQLASSGEASQ